MDRESAQKIYVIEPLLGKLAIEELRILENIASVSCSSQDKWFEKCPKSFKVLGCMQHKLQIKVKEAVEQFALPVLRRVAAPRNALLKHNLIE